MGTPLPTHVGEQAPERRRQHAAQQPLLAREALEGQLFGEERGHQLPDFSMLAFEEMAHALRGCQAEVKPEAGQGVPHVLRAAKLVELRRNSQHGTAEARQL